MEKMSVEDVFIDEKKDMIISSIEEYFPNGGKDYDYALSLFEAIIDGKIPFIGIRY